MRAVSIAAIFLTGTLFASAIAFAWSGPTETPTGGNIAAPVNISDVNQNKDGALGVGGLGVFGNSYFAGSLEIESDSQASLLTLLSSDSFGGYSSIINTTNTPLLFGTNNVEHMRINTGGNVGIGATNPGYKLEVAGRVASNLATGSGSSGRDAWHAIISSDNDTATFTCDRSGASNCEAFQFWSTDRADHADLTAELIHGSAFLYASDGHLKEDARPLSGGLEKLLALSPVSFMWKEGSRKGEEDIGFIAQELEKVAPEVVNTDDEGMKSVDYPKLVPLLVQAIQEQQADNDRQRREIDALKAEIEALKRD